MLRYDWWVMKVYELDLLVFWKISGSKKVDIEDWIFAWEMWKIVMHRFLIQLNLFYLEIWFVWFFQQIHNIECIMHLFFIILDTFWIIELL